MSHLSMGPRCREENKDEREGDGKVGDGACEQGGVDPTK